MTTGAHHPVTPSQHVSCARQPRISTSQHDRDGQQSPHARHQRSRSGAMSVGRARTDTLRAIWDAIPPTRCARRGRTPAPVAQTSPLFPRWGGREAHNACPQPQRPTEAPPQLAHDAKRVRVVRAARRRNRSFIRWRTPQAPRLEMGFQCAGHAVSCTPPGLASSFGHRPTAAIYRAGRAHRPPLRPSFVVTYAATPALTPPSPALYSLPKFLPMLTLSSKVHAPDCSLIRVRCRPCKSASDARRLVKYSRFVLSCAFCAYFPNPSRRMARPLLCRFVR